MTKTKLIYRPLRERKRLSRLNHFQLVMMKRLHHFEHGHHERWMRGGLLRLARERHLAWCEQ